MFATMFSSSMGCGAAGPAGPRHRPGLREGAGAGWRSARLGSARSDRAAASRASPAAAARRALCAPSRGPPLRRHTPPRPAHCLLYSANNRESARRAVFPLDSLFIIPRPQSQEFVQRNRGAGLKTSPLPGWSAVGFSLYVRISGPS